MGKIIFIVGGARSGKSKYAAQLAGSSGGRVAFIATCKADDLEMKERIALHKKSRPAHWKTFEENNDLPVLLKKVAAGFEVIIIDCLTLLVSGFLLKGAEENTIKNKVNQILKIIKKTKTNAFIVSNEVGLGIVPENKLARDFRDITGRINQVVAGKSDSVFFMVSGIPWRIK